MKKKCLAAVLLLALALVFAYAARQVLRQGNVYREAAASYEDLTAYAFAESPAPSSGASPAASPAAKEETPLPQIDFAALKDINPDIVGWLYAEGTSLNYPVVQAEDNDTYLTRLFDGTANDAGCPFLDAGNAADFSDRHSVIYAHNRRDGSMFGELDLFKDQAYYEAHPRLLLLTEEAAYVAEIFSGHVARSDSGAWQIDFADDAAYADWLEVICARSSLETGLQPGPEDRVLTLSTCSYEFEDARYVLHCILRKV